MRIERVMRQDRTTAQVYAMTTTKAYQEQKCRDAGALSWDVTITPDGDTCVVRTKRKLPTVGFPSLIRKIVPSGVTSTETITWGGPGPDGARTATLHVDFHGAPARMSGHIRLRARPDGFAEVVVEADFKALVPVVGKQIEKLAAPIIVGVIDAEEQTSRTWAAESA